jgi:hypothetical protein
MRIWLAILCAAACAAPAEAAVIYLKDGSRLQGTIVGATATDVRLDTGAETLDIDAGRVRRIDDSDDPPPSPPMTEVPAVPDAPLYRPRRWRGEPWEASPARDILSIDLGLAVPVTGVSIPGSGGDATSNGDAGPLAGIEYLHSVSPWLAFGADFEYMYRTPTSTPNLLPGTISNVSGNTEMLLGVAKLSLTDRGYARPYVLGGLGVDQTSTNISATPRYGYTWTDTGTSETRDLVDGGAWGLASTLRFGIDFNVYDPVVFSVEAGWTALSNGRTGATAQGQALGFSGLDGTLGFFTVAGRWGWRF